MLKDSCSSCVNLKSIVCSFKNNANKIIDAKDKNDINFEVEIQWLENQNIIQYQIRMDIMMIDSALNPSEIDKPIEQVHVFSCLSSGDLAITSTLWLTD